MKCLEGPFYPQNGASKAQNGMLLRRFYHNFNFLAWPDPKLTTDILSRYFSKGLINSFKGGHFSKI